MGIMLAFAPFIAFAVLDRFVGATAGLLCGALVSACLLVRDWLRTRRSPKLLEVGTFALFGGMAAYALLGAPEWSVIGVRMRVDAGLLLIVLASMALGRPFTLQYARDQVDPQFWNSAAFVKTNYVITGAWAMAFLIMVLADMVMLYLPDVPLKIGILVTIAALVAAIKFTAWYPERRQVAGTP